MTGPLELQIRREIYNLILKNPGLHAKKIAELLVISGQLADYHLNYLERQQLIITQKEDGYRRCYIEGKLGFYDRRRLSMLRHETPLKIVFYLLDHPQARHRDILEHLSIVKSTLSFHLDKLVKYDIISVSECENEKRYSIKDEEELYELLIRYKPYSQIESLKDTWVDLKWPGTKKKEL